MRRFPYRSHGFLCPYQCGYLCKTPGGLTRHKAACVNNPAFIYVPPSAPSPESPPRTPSPTSHTGENFQALDFPNPHALDFSPSTPANVGDTPAYESPTRVRWVKKGGVRIQIHELLDGTSIISVY
jgi:hypothetical protein